MRDMQGGFASGSSISQEGYSLLQNLSQIRR